MPKRGKPGPKKGQPKPLKRVLDEGFPERLRAALTNNPAMKDVPVLARAVGCSRAVLHQYLDKRKRKQQIETFLLFSIAAALDVSPRWLLLGDGNMGKERSLTTDQDRVLNTATRIKNDELLNKWISIGEDYANMQPDLVATSANPYHKAKVKS